MPAHWSFWDFVDSCNRIEDWYQGLSTEGKDNFNALLKNTRKIQNHLHWAGFKLLRGAAKKERLWQLDFIADKRQYRLLGVFNPGKRAVLVLGCYHKGSNYTPANWLETALKRAKALREGRATIRERQVQDDL